jgi:hypothetical protein
VNDDGEEDGLQGDTMLIRLALEPPEHGASYSDTHRSAQAGHTK